MSAETRNDAEADVKAVFEAVAVGREIDPEVAARVRERADKARDEIFRAHGLLDVGVPAIRELRDA